MADNWSQCRSHRHSRPSREQSPAERRPVPVQGAFSSKFPLWSETSPFRGKALLDTPGKPVKTFSVTPPFGERRQAARQREHRGPPDAAPAGGWGDCGWKHQKKPLRPEIPPRGKRGSGTAATRRWGGIRAGIRALTRSPGGCYPAASVPAPPKERCRWSAAGTLCQPRCPHTVPRTVTGERLSLEGAPEGSRRRRADGTGARNRRGRSPLKSSGSTQQAERQNSLRARPPLFLHGARGSRGGEVLFVAGGSRFYGTHSLWGAWDGAWPCHARVDHCAASAFP